MRNVRLMFANGQRLWMGGVTDVWVQPQPERVMRGDAPPIYRVVVEREGELELFEEVLSCQNVLGLQRVNTDSTLWQEEGRWQTNLPEGGMN